MGRARHWRLFAALTRFWASDRGLSIFSVLLLVVIFVLPPLVAPGVGRSLPGDVLNALLLVSGVLGLTEKRGTRLLLLPVACVAIAVDFGSWILPVPMPWVLGTSLASLLVFLVVVLTQTLRAGPITFPASRVRSALTCSWVCSGPTPTRSWRASGPARFRGRSVPPTALGPSTTSAS